MFENMLKQKGFWAENGNVSDIVISTRIRLARNISGYVFPDKMSQTDIMKLKDDFKNYVSVSDFKDDIVYHDISEIADKDRRFLRERNIITNEIESSSDCAFILDKNSSFSILINEDDHIHIQKISSGFNLHDTYREINKIDDDINRHFSYSFSSQTGYASAYLKNCGTGMSVSVLMHLPMITILKTADEIMKNADENGFELKPVSNDNTKNFGSIYILKNKYSIGKTEIELIDQMDNLVLMISDLENETRDEYIYDSKFIMEDRVFRSFGILKYARSMSYSEALELLSNLRTGVILSFFKNLSIEQINDLMVKIQFAHLEKIGNTNFVTQSECDEFRAGFIRGELPDI
ncbi:MAG: hypothetical protein JW982_14405 [Spirochaetes bacterium]|nr:hypothetical protein [Spirochaetota bacterium]